MSSYFEKNSISLLAKILGCYTVHLENTDPLHIILMRNTFCKIGQPDIIFDLKGSIVNRKSKPTDRI